MASPLFPTPPTPAPHPDELALAFRQAAAASRRRLACAGRETLAAARHALTQGAEGVAKAASLVSAWELPEAPRLPDLPDALWGSYVEWLFASPAALSDADYPALARHLVRRCEELAGWMDRNLAAPSVRAAADAYLRALPPPLTRFPAEICLVLQQARARILQRAHGRSAPAPRDPRPRSGRPLRVGMLHTRYDHRPETFSTLARCAQLDPRRVELHCLALGPAGSVLEERCRELAAFQILPEGFAAQFHALIALELDCLVFGNDLAAHGFPLAHLAQLRAAPLQIATGPITTGLGAIDLLLSGEFDAAARQPRAFGERLALLPGTSLAWDLGPDRPADSAPWTRATLGLSEEETVLVELAPEHPAAADLARWQSLLAAAPDAAVLLVPSPGLVDCSALRSAVLDAGLTNVVVHEPAPFDHAAFASLLALADLAIRLPGPAALLALEAGVPVLAHADAPEAALLRSAGLPDAILADDEVLAEAALRLLRDDVARARLRARVVAAFETLPRFADTYALAADFASLLETAWDELRASGHGRFRRQRKPLRVATPHSLHPGDLHAEALALLAADRPERAVPCLLSALQRAGADPALWFGLARAYHAAGQTASALESLEASLRLDEGNAAAWRLLCELAVSAGNLDLAREALGLAAALAAEHPELPALRARVA